jgi:hypothetical protein
MPADLTSGEYTLAWTWFNKVGNREMYMNCAPIQITGNTDLQQNQYGSRPEMLRANIDNGCSTTEGKDVKFPDPGDSIIRSPNAELELPSGGSACGTVSNEDGTVILTVLSSAALTSTTSLGLGSQDEANSHSSTCSIMTTSAADPVATDHSSIDKTCDREGFFLCSCDGSSFSRCTSSVLSSPVPVPADTQCKPLEYSDALILIAIVS